MRCAFSFARFGLWIHRQFATESNEYNVILTVMNQRHLFNDADWSSVEQHQQKLLSDEILQFNSQRILTSSLEDLVDTWRKSTPCTFRSFKRNMPRLISKSGKSMSAAIAAVIAVLRALISSAAQKSLLQFPFQAIPIFSKPSRILTHKIRRAVKLETRC